MNTCSTCKLCQTTDCIFHFSRSNHHKVCKLIYNNYDLWHLLRALFTFRNTHSLNFAVIFLKISNTVFCKRIVTIHHLCYRPVQCTGSFFRIRDNRNEQMWNTVINTEFHYLRVNHDQFDIFRRCFVQDTYDQGIDTDRFTGTCSTRDQKMWHLGNIRNNRFSCNIFTNCKRQPGLCTLKFL